ncbi:MULTISPECIES: ribosome assembly RNA-binding protein YhbY [Methylomonas]|uniref:ribosome assembly RNA-binding protein YhbY n=1 Tax=Methylomonas TaxID=416 RepID=UPI0016802220|nr:ribosome assembly RNA-binding protein YhbY [Methylomonas rhizoryzae]
MDPIQRKKLKAQAHTLKPVVIVGQAGLTPAVVKEINAALDAHELIKIRIRAERDERAEIAEQAIADTGADWVQSIGQIVVLYRKNPKKK